jgi:hypothetical protein
MINRQNIEEWMLLYADNELSAKDKLAVEQFINEHPHLAEEFQTLLELRLIPEEKTNTTFLSSLYVEDTVLNQQDVTAIIDYADNEGSIGERNKAEENIAADKEWEAFYKSITNSILQPDRQIIFRDKKLLYRKDRPASFTINMTFLMRAAAVLLLITGGVWMSIQFNRDEPIVKNTGENQNTKTDQETTLVAQSPKKTIPSNSTEVPVSSSIQPTISHHTSLKENKITTLTDRTSDINHNLIVQEIQEEAETEMFENKESDYPSIEPPVLNVTQNQPLQNTRRVYLMSSSEPKENAEKLQGVFKQVKRTVNRRLNHLIGNEPLRISIFRIKNK